MSEATWLALCYMAGLPAFYPDAVLLQHIPQGDFPHPVLYRVLDVPVTVPQHQLDVHPHAAGRVGLDTLRNLFTGQVCLRVQSDKGHNVDRIAEQNNIKSKGTLTISFYKDLVMQTHMNYSRYYGVYAAGRTPYVLSEKPALPLSSADPATCCSCIEKNQGVLDISTENGTFSVKIMLNV